MKVLIVGKGGREHAIAWKIAQSPLVTKVYVAPGSEGMKENSSVITIPVAETDNPELVKFAMENKIDLTIIGPEIPLLNGLADDFRKNGLQVFGPDKAAAMIEGSKEFAKDLMAKYNIPTAYYAVFDDYDKAISYVREKGAPIVIKYDGLAAGKGVVVALTMDEAENALSAMLKENKFGRGKVVVEEYLEGPEFSLMAMVNGETVVPLAVARDHKRAFDNDEGPNTGGMGAYSPVPSISREIEETAMDRIMVPMAKAMVSEGCPFCGILYGGLMLTAEGPKVIEFNARFGDPETEVVLPRMKSDLFTHIMDLLHGKEFTVDWDEDTSLGVVMASADYPENATKGIPIRDPGKVSNMVFHMGTALKDGQWLTDGGRVLFVSGKGADMEEARRDAYRAVRELDTEGLFYRNDIGNGA